MNVFEFLRVASGAEKRQLAGTLAVLLAGAIFGVSAMTPPSFEVTESYYQSGRSQVPQTSPPQAPGPVPLSEGFLTSLFTVEVGGKMKSQRLAFQKVVYFSEDGKRLGEATITSVTRNLRVRKSDPAPGQPAPTAPPPEIVKGKLFLWPLEEASLRVATFTQKDFGVTADDRVYAEIHGRSGVRAFKIKTPVGDASGGAPGGTPGP